MSGPEVTLRSEGRTWILGLCGTSLKIGYGDLRVEAVFLFQAVPSGTFVIALWCEKGNSLQSITF